MPFNFQHSKGSCQDELSPEEKAAKQYCEQAFAHIDRFVDLKQAIDRMSKKDDPKLSGKQPDPSTEEVDGAKVSVIDSVGAGDTVGAVIVEGVIAHSVAGLQGRVLNEILHRAAVAAGITCSRAGAQPPYKHELTRAMEK